MPDFERIVDKLSVGLSHTEAQKQFAIGFIAGKKRARLEVLLVSGALIVAAFIGNMAV